MIFDNLVLDILVRTIPALFMGCVFIFLSFAAAQKLPPRSNIAVRWSAAFVVGAWIASLSFQVLRAFVAFDIPWASLLLTGLALSAWYFFGADPKAVFANIGRDLRCWNRVFRLVRRPPMQLLFYPVFAVIVFQIARTLVLPLTGYDAMGYHALKAAFWVRDGAEISFQAPGAWSLHASYPGGFESLMAWFLLPFHGDLLLPMLDISIWIVLAIVTVAICSELGIRGMGRWAAVIYLMMIPVIYLAVGSGKNDTPLALFLLTSFLFGCRWLRLRNVYDLVICFMSLGLATGIKISSLPIVALVFCVLTWLTFFHPFNRFRFLGGYLLSCGTLAAAFIAWPIRGYLKTGFPFGKVPIEIAGIKLGADSPYLDWFKQVKGVNPYDFDLEMAVFLYSVKYMGWPTVAFFVLGLIGIMRFFSERPKDALLALSVLTGTLLFYFSPDFSYVRIVFSGTSGRFLLPVIFLCTAFSFYLTRTHKKLQFLLSFIIVGIALGQLAIYIPLWRALDVWLMLGATMTMGLLYVVWQGASKLNKPVLFTSLVMISLVLLGVVRDHTRYELLQNINVFPPFPKYWVAGAKIFDEVGTSHRIAVTAGPNRHLISWPLYHFLGRRYQNKLLYIPVTIDGTVAPLIPGIEEKADYLSWQQRLVDTKIDNVVSFKPSSVELKWMEQHSDRFQRLFGDGNSWGVYRVLGGPT